MQPHCNARQRALPQDLVGVEDAARNAGDAASASFDSTPARRRPERTQISAPPRVERSMAALLPSAPEHLRLRLGVERPAAHDVALVVGRAPSRRERSDEAALALRAGLAEKRIDSVDELHLSGLIAASRGEREPARALLGQLRAAVLDPNTLPSQAALGVVQWAEVAAVLDDLDGVVEAARAGVRPGWWNAELWRRHFVFARASSDSRLRAIADDCEKKAGEIWGQARRAGHAD